MNKEEKLEKKKMSTVKKVILSVLLVLILAIVSFIIYEVATVNNTYYIGEKNLQIPVFVYHDIVEDESQIEYDYMQTTAKQFEKQITGLMKLGYKPISYEDLVAYKNGEKAIPKWSFLITFDDGYTGVYKYAFEIAKKYNIHVISFVNLILGKEVTCYNPDLSPEEERQKGTEYYNAMREGCEIKTGLISTATFEEEFEKVLQADQDVLYFSLSKNISGNYNSARLAAEEVMDKEINGRKIRLIDSLNASLAQGILAIYASEMRDKGMAVDAVADVMESYVGKMNGVFTVGDLKYLSRTGRIKGSVATIGNVLKIKPILRGDKDGYIVTYKNVRGRKAALNTLVNLVCSNIVDSEQQIIGIAHADAYEDSLYIMNKIQERIKVRDFINTSYDFCTGSHVGPDTIALFFIGNDRELSQN